MGITLYRGSVSDHGTAVFHVEAREGRLQVNDQATCRGGKRVEIVKIGLLGLVSVGIALFIKQTRPELAYIFIVCTGLFLFYLCFDTFAAVTEMTGQIGESLGEYHPYIRLLLKIVGISYISEFCSGMCQDAGYQALGRQVEIAGKFCVLLTGLPVFYTLIDTIREYF